MKKVFAIGIVLIIAVASFAADLVVSGGTVVIKDAEKPLMRAWLDTQPDLYVDGDPVFTTNRSGQIDLIVTNIPRILVPETTKEKAERTYETMSRANLANTVLMFNVQKAQGDAAPVIRAAGQVKVFED